MELFIGGSGKDHSHCMASDCQFVVFDTKKVESFGVKTIEEAFKYYQSDAVYEVYVWDAGLWREVNYMALNLKPTKTIGFKP